MVIKMGEIVNLDDYRRKKNKAPPSQTEVLVHWYCLLLDIMDTQMLLDHVKRHIYWVQDVNIYPILAEVDSIVKNNWVDYLTREHTKEFPRGVFNIKELCRLNHKLQGAR